MPRITRRRIFREIVRHHHNMLPMIVRADRMNIVTHRLVRLHRRERRRRRSIEPPSVIRLQDNCLVIRRNSDPHRNRKIKDGNIRL